MIFFAKSQKRFKKVSSAAKAGDPEQLNLKMIF
jgi:hypothetical protein